MNGAFDLFKPEPVRACPPSPDVRAKLAQLRSEALERARALVARAPDTFRPVRVH